jgi:hypothetical protein
MLISADYREQNIQLHEANPSYGIGGLKWVHRVKDLMREHDYKNVLDYGCGKGELKNNLPRWLEVFEYDPAIPGKDNKDQSADLVVCTDVLEHIEPDLFDGVLEHLRTVTVKKLIFNIALRPAKKALPDGRNAHLILESPEWWNARLGRYFQIDSWEVKFGHSVCGEATPLREIGDVITIIAMKERFRTAHVRKNCQRVTKRLQDNIPAHDRTAILVCYGPSLLETWPTIAMGRMFPKVDIFTVSAAHKFMVERGVIPLAHIDCDPRNRKAVQIGKPHKDVAYWLASCVHPHYLDRLKGCDVSLWHLHNGTESEVAYDIDSGCWMLIGGGSVGLRAISLLYSQGYRRFVIHGMDCSFKENEQYAGEHLAPKKRVIRVRCKDRWFDTSPILAEYARQFISDQRLWPNARFEFAGNGLLQEMLKP